MKNKTLILTLTIVNSLIFGCSTEDSSPFGTGGGSSSSNIISDKNFGVGASPFNPAVLDDDGYHGSITSTISVRAGDRNNLAVTSGVIHFRSEYGILSSTTCTLDSTGTCSVTWTSILDGIPTDLSAGITAYTIGEESFLDSDGSGTFNDGDIVLSDTTEPFIDFNGNYSFEDGTDIPIDLDDSLSTTGTAHTGIDGLVSVSGCAHSTLCAASGSIYIFDQMNLNLDARTPATP